MAPSKAVLITGVSSLTGLSSGSGRTTALRVSSVLCHGTCCGVIDHHVSVAPLYCPRVDLCCAIASGSPTSRPISQLASRRSLREPANADKALVASPLALRLY